MKPVDVGELRRAIEKFNARRSPYYNGQLQVLLSNLTQSALSRKIVIPTSQGLSFVLVNELVICQADSNYTIVYTTSGDKKISSKTLGDFEYILPDFFLDATSHS